MKHIVEYSQIELFKTNQYLELEGLLAAAKLKELTNCINQELAKIRKIQIEPSSAFLHFHDLFKQIGILKKLLTSPAMANVISHLTNEKYFRLLFDQMLIYPKAKNFPDKLNLKNDLSFQGVILGALIQFEGTCESSNDYFPKQLGNITFFNPEFNLDLTDFLAPTSKEILLVGFGAQDSRYRFKESDPHTHLLKNYGYVFGDPLTNAHHPLFFCK